MKKYISLVLLTVLLLGALAACGTTPAETTPVTPTPTTPAPTTPAPTTPAPTTPAPTTPAPTTPVVTTPTPTTPLVTTPAPTTPVVTPAPTPTDSPMSESPYTLEQLHGWNIWPIGSFACEDGYLGTYNGYAVYTCRSAFSGSVIKEIGGVEFWWGEPYAIVCKDGFIFEIESAYQKEILTAEDLSAIARDWYGGQSPEEYESVLFHESTQDESDAPYPPLDASPYTIEQLYEWKITPTGCFQSVSGYLGTYNGWSVYSVQKNIRDSTIVRIGGVGFWIGESSMFVCKDGTRYTSLFSAYADGLLNIEDLRAIAHYLYGNIPLEEYESPIFHNRLHPVAEPTLPDDPPSPDPIYPPQAQSPYTADQLYAWGVRQMGSFASEDGFLGIYNGYAVYACRSPIREASTIKEEYGVRHWTGEVYAVVCKDGDVYKIMDARNRGLLTNKDLQDIFDYWYGGLSADEYEAPIFHETDAAPPNSPYPLVGESPYTQEEIIALIKSGPRGFNRCLDGYLGTYSGYAVYITENDLRGYGKTTIGGVEFWYGQMWAFATNGEETHELTRAYEAGLLTDEDIRAIGYYWYGDPFPEDAVFHR